MNTRFIFVLFAVLVSLSVSQAQDLFKDVVLQSVERAVDVRSQLVKIKTTIEIKNERDTPLNEVYFAIPSEQAESLRLFVIVDHYNTSKKYDYKIIDNLKIKSEHNATLYKLELDTPLKSGQARMFETYETHWGSMTPLPRHINVFDDQKMVLEDSTYYFTPYTVLTQTTTYNFNGAVISYSDADARSRGQQLDYQFSSTVSGFQRRHNRIHFENNTPFVVFKEVTKIIEVSHWGNINIQEFYKLANEGAEFKGEFSRIDFSTQNRNSGKSALRGLLAKYPVHAWGMHFRDEVGNISTSRAYRDSSNVVLQIQPRFAIFGGWSHNWDISYNLDTSHYLFVKENNPSSFVLRQDFGFPFENIIAEKYTLKVILPEGASNFKVDLPFSVDNQREEKTYSYLDYAGRPTIILEKKDVLDYHSKQFTVSYEMESQTLAGKAILLFGFFLAVFAVLIVIGRIDFSFKRKAD